VVDVVIISRNLPVLEKLLQELDKTAQELELVISQDETKYMRVSKNSHNKCKQIASSRRRVWVANSLRFSLFRFYNK
jgi:3-polyprenyl-4-hydroxybenzoate decarboxylase